MFDSLSDKLHGVFKKLRGASRLSESNIAEAMSDIRLALLEADRGARVRHRQNERLAHDAL